MDNKTLQNIINFFKDNRPDLQNRWWHRLANVILYGSSLLLFLSILGLFLLEQPWEITTYHYSFELDYENIDAFESNCNFLGTSYISVSGCGDIYSADTFLERYTKARGTFSKLEEAYTKGATAQQIIKGLKENNALSDIRVKKAISNDYTVFILLFGVLIVAVPVWFIILRNIIYKTILYIVLGK